MARDYNLTVLKLMELNGLKGEFNLP
ncbi:hypothetical protein FQB35_14835 [Crassaminicella thermophila]|uniref:Uncharacterized protein n=1 Tax=Crassaminicella thermophila TaxID=2599308 RepID=A0A5C0SJ36_CRATE|nr:hypothetical protein FQB35_14835 [Crassaminicella thermophila]